MGARLEVFRTVPADAEFRQQWNALAQSMEHPEVFYTWEWAAAVSRSFAEVRPLILAMFRDNSLAGIVALEERNLGTFLTAPTADYCEFVSAPADRREFIELVLQELIDLRLGSLKLSNIPSESETVGVLRSVSTKLDYAQFSRPAYSCAQVLLESPQRRIQAATAARNSPKRTARLSRLGAIRLEHCCEWREFAGEFDNFVNAHIARFRAQGKVSSLEEHERRHFLQELGALLSEQGSLRCSVLRLGDRPVAWHFGMAYQGKWFWYQPAFDLSCDGASPGTYLLREVIREAATSPEFTAIDLGLGDESYKTQYASSARRTLHFTLDISKLRLAKEISRYYAARVVKRSPKLERLARAAMAAARSQRESADMRAPDSPASH